MPDTPITITTADAIAQVQLNVDSSITDLNTAIDVAITWNDLYVDSGAESIRDFARALAADFNKLPKSERMIDTKVITLSDTKYNSYVARCVEVASAHRDMPQAKWLKLVTPYVVKTVSDGRQVKISGIAAALKDTKTPTKVTFDADKVAKRAMTFDKRDLTRDELVAVIAAMQAKLAKMEVSLKAA